MRDRISAVTLEPAAVGIDSLYLSSFIDGAGIDWDQLDYEREKLRATPGKEFAEFVLGKERFGLKRGGRKPYSFILKNSAFELQLGRNIHPRCHAQFASELLWRAGLDAALRRFAAMWAGIGARETRPEVIARVDVAFDFAIGAPDFGVDDFVSIAAKDANWREHRKPQTFMFGRSNIVCRVYDKVAEIAQQSGKAWLFDIWGVREGVWRCEFQIRGERLKSAGIATIEQLRAHLPDLTRDLARRHTSLRVPNADSNRSRWPLHPMWTALLAAADKLITPPAHPPPHFHDGINYALERACASVLGDLKGIDALLSHRRPNDPLTLPQTLHWLSRKLARSHSPELWKADVMEKIRKRELQL
ncbi:MAG TPA: hypothetical protein VGF97_06745 [Rhizomicrobium sp.]|jgi:hypothetical protein